MKEKQTELMTKLYSGHDATKNEVVEAISEASTKGTAETKNYSLSRLGDKVLVEDKMNGEITSIKETPDTYRMSAIKCYSEDTEDATGKSAKTAEDTKVVAQENKQEAQAPISPEDLAGMVTSEVTKAMSTLKTEMSKEFSDKFSSIEKNFSDLTATVKKFSEGKVETMTEEKPEEVTTDIKVDPSGTEDKGGEKKEGETKEFSMKNINQSVADFEKVLDMSQNKY